MPTIIARCYLCYKGVNNVLQLLILGMKMIEEYQDIQLR
jgi:hypothetical protein